MGVFLGDGSEGGEVGPAVGGTQGVAVGLVDAAGSQEGLFAEVGDGTLVVPRVAHAFCGAQGLLGLTFGGEGADSPVLMDRGLGAAQQIDDLIIATGAV